MNDITERLGGFVAMMLNKNKEKIKRKEGKTVDKNIKNDEAEVRKHEESGNVEIVERSDYRPFSFKEFINDSNKQAVKILEDAVKASTIKGEALPHILFFGPAGVGKTTTAKICNREMGNSEFIETVGSALKTQADIMSLLIKVWRCHCEQNKDVIIFIDEIHELGNSRLPETLWYAILEDFTFYHSLKGKVIDDIEILDKRLDLSPFTIIGATTDPADLKAPLRDRFKIHCELRAYSEADIKKVIKLGAKKRGYEVTPKAIEEIAKRSKGNPRLSVSYLESAERKRTVKGYPKINQETLLKVFDDLQIDKIGLSLNDIHILEALKKRPKGIGIKSLSGIVNINERTLADMYLAYLDRIGLTEVTHKRFITKEGKQYLEEKR